MRVENHYLLIQLHWDFQVRNKARIQCYKLDCNCKFLIILLIMVLLNEIYFSNVICNHSVLQSYPVTADCHYWEEAGLLELKWDAESIIHQADSTFPGSLSNTLPLGILFCKMKNSQICWPHYTHIGFQPSLKTGYETSILSHSWWWGWLWLIKIPLKVGRFHWQQERCWRLPDQGLVATASAFSSKRFSEKYCLYP